LLSGFASELVARLIAHAFEAHAVHTVIASFDTNLLPAMKRLFWSNRGESTFVLHAFQKKTQTTSRRDIELARTRWAQLKKEQ
jgi:phage-related protein